MMDAKGSPDGKGVHVTSNESTPTVRTLYFSIERFGFVCHATPDVDFIAAYRDNLDIIFCFNIRRLVWKVKELTYFSSRDSQTVELFPYPSFLKTLYLLLKTSPSLTG